MCSVQLAATALLTLLAAAPAPRQQVPAIIVPVDEGERDPSFSVFRTELTAAAKRGDLRAVFAMTSSDVRASGNSEDPQGLAALRRKWNISAAPSRFLRELLDVVQLGGRFVSPCEFVAPYTFTEFNSPYDASDYVIAVHDGAQVHERADVRSPVLATTKFDVLRYDTGSSGWVHVKLGDGGWGYIERRFVRMPNGTQAYFTKIMGDWKLVGFYAGVD